DELPQLSTVGRVGSGLGQTHQHAIEDLARGLARERAGQNLLDGDAAADEAQIAVRQLKRLAGAGRGPDHEMPEANVFRRSHQFDSSSRPRPPNWASWQI